MTTVITAILDVFSAVGSWIPDAVDSMVPIFWTAGADGAGQLTFMGTLAVIGLGFGVIFLIIGLIQKFLTFGA